MKIKLLCCMLALLFALPVAAESPMTKSGGSSFSATVDNTTYIDANRILMFVTNHGNFGRDLSGYFGYDYGTFFPYGGNPEAIAENDNSAGDRSPIYASGIWIGGIVDGAKRVTISEFDSEYGPGPMIDDTSMSDRSAFRVYKLYRDSLKNNSNDDYDAYMRDAVVQGAPTEYDDDGDLVPEMIGDQMLWSVYNEADPSRHISSAGKTPPLGLEIKQTTFAFDRQGSLGNMLFVRYRVFNKGSNDIDSMFISLWCDPDLGDASDDLVGCDTVTSLGYVYNDGATDAQYLGSAPPAMGFDFFQGPLEHTGVETDTALMWGYAWPNYKNLPMSSFNKYINGTEPTNFTQAYYYMLGLNGREDGEAYVYDDDTLTFMHSGDPTIPSGDIDDTPADRRFMVTTGPFTFAPGDSTEIIAAVIMGQGGSNLNSVTILKNLDEFAQRVYDGKIDTLQLFFEDTIEVFEHISFQPPDPPAKPVVEVSRINDEIIVTWGDTSEVTPGDYRYEGYSVWQGESESGPWVELATYDIDNDRTDALIDSVFDNYSGTSQPVVMRGITNSGLDYSYNATVDEILGGAFKNQSKYYFKVSAFAYAFAYDDADTLWVDVEDNVINVGDRFIESATIVTIIPEDPLAGEHFGSSANDTLAVTHISGPVPSGGQVFPMVMDPQDLTGHTYHVVFVDEIVIGADSVFWNGKVFPADTVLAGPLWNIFDATTGDTLAFAESNQSGDEEYLAFDGLLVKVLGPPLAMDTWDYTGADREIGGVNWGGSGFFGGIGVLGEWWDTDLTPADAKIVEIRWVADGTGQNAYIYDRSNGYVFETYAPQNFTVWDVTPGAAERQITFGFVENDWDLPHTQRDQIWNPGEQLEDIDNPFADSGSWDHYGGREYFEIMNGDYTVAPDPNYAIDGFFTDGTATPVVRDILWGGWLNNRGDSQPTGKPVPGDVMTLIPYFINTPADTFIFTTTAPSFTSNESDLDRILTVPNPFYLNSSYDPSPGQYNLKFNNLPAECTIDIYNIAGEHIRKLEKNDATTSEASWDLLTTQGLPIASGVYIYVVEAPGFGQKIGKTAIFIEQEVLKIF